MQNIKGKLRQGLRIFGRDNREYGTVDRYDDQYAYVGQRRIPLSAFERMDNDRLYVGDEGARYFTETETAGAEGAMRVPVAEERLSVDKRAVDRGNVEVHKTVETEQVSVPVELRQEEVRVQEVDVKDRPLAAGDKANLFQEQTIRVPVHGEEAVVRKEAVVTGEVVIDRYQTVEREEVQETLRHERVQVDENYKKARADFQQHYTANRGRSGHPPFEEAEGTYRTGFRAAHDKDYSSREWDDVEPDLRREWESSGKRGGNWETLREEIREGWTRARGR